MLMGTQAELIALPCLLKGVFRACAQMEHRPIVISPSLSVSTRAQGELIKIPECYWNNQRKNGEGKIVWVGREIGANGGAISLTGDPDDFDRKGIKKCAYARLDS